MKKLGMKQVGFMIFGGGLNARVWLDQAKDAGLVVMIRDGYAEFWK